jgi:hypothetical protein
VHRPKFGEDGGAEEGEHRPGNPHSEEERRRGKLRGDVARSAEDAAADGRADGDGQAEGQAEDAEQAASWG